MTAAEHSRLNAAVAYKHGVSVAEVQAYGRRSFDHGRRHRLQPCNKVDKLPPCFDREPGVLARSQKKGGCIARIARWEEHLPPQAKPTKAERRQSWRRARQMERRDRRKEARLEADRTKPPPGGRKEPRPRLVSGFAGIHPGPGGFKMLFPAEDFRTGEEQRRRDALKSSYRRRQMPKSTHGLRQYISNLDHLGHQMRGEFFFAYTPFSVIGMFTSRQECFFFLFLLAFSCFLHASRSRPEGSGAAAGPICKVLSHPLP